MGIPAYFRWISERYPKIMVDCVEFVDYDEDSGTERRIDASKANPNGIEFDNLYLDMNGIIHPCTHPEDGPAPTTEQEMFDAVCTYVDRVFSIVRPRRLLYMAIDGVAPRAKINQQRSRRFRSAKEAETSREEALKLNESWREMGLKVQTKDPDAPPPFDSNVITPGTPFMARLAVELREYVAQRLESDPGWANIRVLFSDASVPGEGEHKIAEFIRLERAQPNYDPNIHHIMYGLDADLIMLALSTHEVRFSILREEVFQKRGNQRNGRGVGAGGSAADPRHGSRDGHGMRGEVVQIESTLASQFRRDMELGGLKLRKEIGNRKPFHFLHVNVLREYLDAEYRDDISREIADCSGTEVVYDLERVIDDFVFLCFFVGNDFLPHLPTLDIREGAVDYLIELYKKELPRIGYLTSNGGDVDFVRVRKMLLPIGQKEDEIFKERTARELAHKARREREKEEIEARKHADRSSATPPQQQQQINPAPVAEPMVALGVKKPTRYGSGENNARAEAALRAVLARPERSRDAKRKTSEHSVVKPLKAIKPSHPRAATAVARGDEANANTDESVVKSAAEFKEALHQRLREKNEIKNPTDNIKLGEDGWKDRYYEKKFHWKANDVEPKHKLLQSYLEGLYWVMKYYYVGCVSWGWYYPYHYAPFASDLVECDIVADDINLDLGEPFKPFTQLQAVMPASSGKLVLPTCYSDLMTDPKSPILDYYPEEFELDLNGKRFAWQGVALLPFIDEQRLKDAMAGLDDKLTEEERRRNSFGESHIVCTAAGDLGTFIRAIDKHTPVSDAVAAGQFFGTVSAPTTGSTSAIVFAEFRLPPYLLHSSALLEAARAPDAVLHDGHKSHFRRGGWKAARFGILGRAAREILDERMARCNSGGTGAHRRNARPSPYNLNHAQRDAGAAIFGLQQPQHAWMQRGRPQYPQQRGSRYLPPHQRGPARSQPQPLWTRAPYQQQQQHTQHYPQNRRQQPTYNAHSNYAPPQWTQRAYQPYQQQQPHQQPHGGGGGADGGRGSGGGLAGPTASLLRRGRGRGRGRGHGGRDSHNR